VSHPRIVGIGTANPLVRLTQEQSFHVARYKGERIRKIFLNSDIDPRHFYLEGTLNRGESSDQLNQRYLRGAMQTGCRAIYNCLKSAGASVQDVDFLSVCTCTGYVCPDIVVASSRIWASVTTCRGRRSSALDVREPFRQCSERLISFAQQPGDWGVMIALGPGMAAEVALLRW